MFCVASFNKPGLAKTSGHHGARVLRTYAANKRAVFAQEGPTSQQEGILGAQKAYHVQSLANWPVG